jgi:hypothetical protein
MRGALGATAAVLAVLLGLAPVLVGVPAFVVACALVWLTSTFGITSLNASLARLSDLHPHDSATVITEANAGAAWVGVLSPLLLGVALGAGFGWGAGVAVSLVVVLAALAGLVVGQRRTAQVPIGAAPAATGPGQPAAAAAPTTAGPTTAASGDTARTDRPMGRMFWWCMAAIFTAVATEFGVNFWGSTLIREQTGAVTATATAAMSASVIGVALGRTVAPWLIARLGTHRTLIGGFVVAIVGFAVLWSAGTIVQAVLGLLLTGLGLAPLFPLLLDRAIVLSEGRADLALSRASLVLAFAVGGAPFALGALGAVVPVQRAFLLVPVMIAIGLVAATRSRPPAALSPRPSR